MAARHRALDEEAFAAVDPDAGVDLQRLTAGWLRRWRTGPPLGAALPGPHADRLLRLSGPAPAAAGPDLPLAYRTMLTRYNTLLDRLFGRREVYVVAGAYADVTAPVAQPECLATLNPGAVHWLRLLGRDAQAYHDRALDLFAARRPWRAGCLDPLLVGATVGHVANAMIMDVDLYRIFHPHRDGADVLTLGPAEREELRLDYGSWVTPTHAGNMN